MEAPKEIYVHTDSFGFMAAYRENHPPKSIKYIRSDLAVEKEKLVEWLETQNCDKKIIQPIIEKLKTL